MKEADGVLLGSPSYSANVSANMQAFLERAAVVCDLNPGLVKHKVGAAVAAARRAGPLQAIDTMNHFFLNHEMVVAGSTYWNMAYGRLPGEVEKDKEGMANMQNLGENMAFLLKAIEKQKKIIETQKKDVHGISRCTSFSFSEGRIDSFLPPFY